MAMSHLAAAARARLGPWWPGMDMGIKPLGKSSVNTSSKSALFMSIRKKKARLGSTNTVQYVHLSLFLAILPRQSLSQGA